MSEALSVPLLGEDLPAEEEQQHDDAALERLVVQKIDQRLLPLLFVTYMLNFMDKTILASAAVFGLIEDTHLHGQQYSWVGSIFYVGYLLWEYPTTLLIARLPVGKYLAVNNLFWGFVVALTAACTNYRGLMTVRFLLGAAEATITPGFMFITSTWYTRDEMPSRVGIWFAGNAVGGLVSSLFAYAVGHVHGQVHPWRWMYLILGTITFFWAIPMFLLLPDSISKAAFLSKDERHVAKKRVEVDGTGSTEKTRWQRDQFLECLVDPKSWLILSIQLLAQIPNSGTQYFANIVIRSFGFSSLQSTLINIPYSIVSASVIYGTGYLAGRYQTLNCVLIMTVIIPCVIGATAMYVREVIPPSLHLVAYFFLSTGPAAMPLIMALVQSNYRGVTKKMTITALLFVVYCLGNIIGPQLFQATEAPTYTTGFKAIVGCYTSAIILTQVLRRYLRFLNAERQKREYAGLNGTQSNEEQSGQTDQTDWGMPGFIYRF
ncbi:major facilitator superfamily domain-containing protein [Stachybotrys elegans]|uniref:Major facilitator superfamily domain-containing protein n=1 Tax=Stachybotrys elegans TaxID=80388 RepID=A0A8K0WMH9_9HYPO|nr:major facilitator superfamily domain-containing protein [Stachybotrys elegans]